MTAGLVARTIEERAKIPTVAISNSLEYTKLAPPPRAVSVRFPFGHATGEANKPEQQRRIVLEALALLKNATAPEIRPLPYKWRRTDYDALPPIEL